MASFASPEDLQARWRLLSASERVTAGVLLADASDIIRTRWPDIDQRLLSGAISDQTLRRVAANMVKRAMVAVAAEGVTQQSQAAGPFSVAQTFANPNGNLYLSADDIAALSGDGYERRARTGWLA